MTLHFSVSLDYSLSNKSKVQTGKINNSFFSLKKKKPSVVVFDNKAVLVYQSALPNTASLTAPLRSPICQQTRRKTQSGALCKCSIRQTVSKQSSSNLQSMFHQSGCHAVILSESVRQHKRLEMNKVLLTYFKSRQIYLESEFKQIGSERFKKVMKDINTDLNKHIINFKI